MKKRDLVSVARNHSTVPAMNFPLQHASAADGERRPPFEWLVGQGADFVVGLFPGDAEGFHGADDVLRHARRGVA